jgi:hypothetical protein
MSREILAILAEAGILGFVFSGRHFGYRLIQFCNECPRRKRRGMRPDEFRETTLARFRFK